MNNPYTDDDSPDLLTVSQLNRRAKSLLDSHFGFVWVQGEVSNFAAPSSGHWYFSLKDGKAQVRCAMFARSNQRIKLTPENGDAVRLRCRVSLYEGRGEFQLIVEHLEPAGAGALQIRFEKLKAKLDAEGLFDQTIKTPLPSSIAQLAVITSATGAAIHDILTVLRRRSPAITVYILPVSVQGDSAANEISTAITMANRWHRQNKIKLDALIVARGGGSLEDLWAFNEEVVARAIHASTLPIVSAVGHEVDFSIADMAADLRAPTPSAAAELLSADQQEWQQQLHSVERDLTRLMQVKLANFTTHLRHLKQRLKHPQAQLRENAQRLDDLEQRLFLAQSNTLLRHRGLLSMTEERLLAQTPLPRIQQLKVDGRRSKQQLEAAIQLRLQESSEHLVHLGKMLNSLSPLNTLRRGYAVVTDRNGNLLRNVSATSIGDAVEAKLAQGRLGLTVTSVDKNH